MSPYTDLSRRFGDTIALDRVTLSVARGTVFGLVGENGAGKTTLIRHLLGLQRAQAGSVRVFGLDPVSEPVGVLSRIGYALSWEYWRRGMYWFVPACAVLVVALMAPAYAVLTNYADVRAELSRAVFGFVCWGPLVMALASRGLLRRHYALPVRTGTLVGWTLANGSLAVAIAYWLVALGFNTLFHAEWPFGGPAWWAVVVYAIFQATMWSVAGGRSALLIAVVCLALLTVFTGPPNLYQRLVPTASDGGDALIWPTMSAAELAASLVVVALFYLAAVYVVGRDRRGDAWTLAWFSPAWWMHRIGDRVHGTLRNRLRLLSEHRRAA